MNKANHDLQRSQGRGWESIVQAARRLGIAAGHLRRLCKDRLEAAGQARLISGGGRRSRWQIQSDYLPRHAPAVTVIDSAPVNQRSPSMTIRAGSLTIDIQFPAGGKIAVCEAIEDGSKTVSIDIR